MNNPFKQDEVLEIIRKTLSRVLGRPVHEIASEAALMNDLNAESLDFLEFRHDIEQRLGIVLSQRSVLDHLVSTVGDVDKVYQAGRLTGLAATVLHRSFFRYGEQQIRAGMQPFDVMAATTVGNWTAYCHAMFNYLPDVCPACGGGEATKTADGRAACAGCSSSLTPLSGDEALSRHLPGMLKELQNA